MITEKLKLTQVPKEFFTKFLEPFDEGYDASKIINQFWEKYSLQEVMINVYQVLQKAKDYENDYPLFKTGLDGFIGEAVSVLVAHYFYFQWEFTEEEVDIPINKSFHGAVYPKRKGFIDELQAVFDLISREPAT
ncbi:hypothetical protein [Parapedobacter tibetensis]|uniref:hypothetical protein n=1 Tax=Parapedobacter tibetensis TaxID=2972951 RepID=UPI00214DED84|nr:hypothetical protein [Parapedobacter tibetensis]